MKTTIYLRIGRDSKKNVIRTEASDKPNFMPLKIGKRYIPTVAFGVEFEIPDELFAGASLIVGLLKLKTKEVSIATHIKTPKII